MVGHDSRGLWFDSVGFFKKKLTKCASFEILSYRRQFSKRLMLEMNNIPNRNIDIVRRWGVVLPLLLLLVVVGLRPPGLMMRY
jgi:hypothetical protein